MTSNVPGDRPALDSGSDDELPRSIFPGGNVEQSVPGRGLGVSWTDFFPVESPDSASAGALQVEAGHLGGLWELGRDAEDLAFLVDLVHSVVACRVVEVFGLARSRVEVTLSDGTVAVETGGVGPAGCLPVPGWVRRGRRVSYAPYR